MNIKLYSLEDKLRDTLIYAPERGGSCLRWNPMIFDVGHRRCIGHQTPHGKWVVQVYGKRYQASRLVWFLNYRNWPVSYLIHINGDNSDTRIENLKEKNENAHNNYAPVYRLFPSTQWAAQVRVNGRLHHVGIFDSEEEAMQAHIQRQPRRNSPVPIKHDAPPDDELSKLFDAYERGETLPSINEEADSAYNHNTGE